jgi:exo-1,4-beta-D-glucosaminidase
VFVRCLDKRYGEATDLDDFLMKSQVLRYEAIRAMYEGYSRNKYTSTGVIAWMLNNGWPSLIWNLYDYDLRTAGSYFGTKISLEPLHPLYGYDDHAVWVVSSQYSDADNLTVTAKIYDLNMKERFSKHASLNAAADSTNRMFTLPEIPDLTPVYFLKLSLTDESGKLIGSNFYWLTSKPETVTHGIINIDDGFAKDFADFRTLSELKRVAVKATAATGEEHGSSVTHVTLKNDNATLAFFVHLKLSRCGSDQDIVPTLWSDNYISLLPGETRELTATVRNSQTEPVRVDIDGWNVDHVSAGCTH